MVAVEVQVTPTRAQPLNAYQSAGLGICGLLLKPQAAPHSHSPLSLAIAGRVRLDFLQKRALELRD